MERRDGLVACLAEWQNGRMAEWQNGRQREQEKMFATREREAAIWRKRLTTTVPETEEKALSKREEFGRFGLQNAISKQLIRRQQLRTIQANIFLFP